MLKLSLAGLPRRSLQFADFQEAGRGHERRCFVSDRHPRLIFKCSRFEECAQSLREASYYRHLRRRGVPMTHLPHFITIFKTAEFVVSIQQYITANEHYEVQDLEKALQKGLLDGAKLQRAYDEFKAYLFKWRINTNDMFTHNFLLKIYKKGPKAGEYRLMLIDGLGAVTLIPLANYARFLSEKRIRRQCLKFVKAVFDVSGGKISLTL